MRTQSRSKPSRRERYHALGRSNNCRGPASHCYAHPPGVQGGCRRGSHIAALASQRLQHAAERLGCRGPLGCAAPARSWREQGEGPCEREFGLGNFFFIGHQNTEQQRRAVEELIEAHNEDSAWLRWYTSEKALSITEHAVLPPELAPAQRVVYAWRGSVDHCTHGVLLRNSGRAARETSYEFLRSYNRAHGLQLAIEHFDQQLSDCLRLLPDDPE